MPDQLKFLKFQAAETAQGLAEKVRKFEQGVKEQASATREATEKYLKDPGLAARNARGVVGYKVREYPLPAVGAAVLLGFVTTFWFNNTWGPTLRRISKEFEPELKKVRSAAFLILTKAATSQLIDAYPVLTEKLSDILEEKVTV